MTATSWQTRGTCRSHSPDEFFLLAYQAARHDVKAAKQICRGCPVLNECRTWALANPGATADGIWGGLTPPERDRARRAERTAAA